jgi:hypothetical protein
MELLQIDAMSTTFNMHDVIYIVVAVASGLAFYWKMVLNDKEMDSKIERLKEDQDKNESIMFKKFAAIHTRMEKGEANTREELTTLNTEITEVKLGISAINGKLDILINK